MTCNTKNNSRKDKKCTKIGKKWSKCVPSTSIKVITHPNKWYFDNILPNIPKDTKGYHLYTKPFGGATNASFYRKNSTKTDINTVTKQGIQTKVGSGVHDIGNRAPLHEHKYGAVSTVIQGYVTLFLEGCAPVVAGPTDSYYMPGGGLRMCAAIMPKVVYKGKIIKQKKKIILVDNFVSPNGAGALTWVEDTSGKKGGTDWTKLPPMPHAREQEGIPYGKCGKKCCPPKNKAPGLRNVNT